MERRETQNQIHLAAGERSAHWQYIIYYNNVITFSADDKGIEM